ncbi:MAG: histone deacetylase family protein [Caulobacterales bacterium]
MRTALFTHPACLEHRPPVGHPERPERLLAVLKGLEGDRFVALDRREAPRASSDVIALVHTAELVDALAEAGRAAAFNTVQLDPDTYMSAGSLEAAWRAAGAATAAVDCVLTGETDAAFCAVRPPGHHAEPEAPMGFCLFNNVAIAAQYARAAYGIKRPAVVDFDVHHGNGTQAAFWNDADLFYASIHQFPFYPGTGAARESGMSGNIVNAPLHSGASAKEWRDAFAQTIIPKLSAFAPDLLFISAGFDAHQDDPLANFNLDDEDFGWATRELIKACRVGQNGGARGLVSCLEGGYDLAALRDSTAAHVSALLES